MLTGMLAVRNLIYGEKHDLWQVNADQEYHEEVREKIDFEPEITTEAVKEAFARAFPKLDRVALGLSMGTLAGILLFIATLILVLLTLDDGRGRQVIGGLCQEMTDRVARRGAAYFPPKTEWGSEAEALIRRDQRWGLVWGHGPHRVRYSAAYDPEEFKFALNQMVEEARVRLLLHSYSMHNKPKPCWSKAQALAPELTARSMTNRALPVAKATRWQYATMTCDTWMSGG